MLAVGVVAVLIGFGLVVPRGGRILQVVIGLVLAAGGIALIASSG